MRIISQTPTRIGLIGGGTDVEPFASKYGGRVLSLAINLKHEAILIPQKNKDIRISALGEKRSFSLEKKLVYRKDPKFDLIYSVINYFKPRLRSGFIFHDIFEVKETGGLGSSASASVSMIGAFCSWLGIKMTKKEIALLSWKLEVEKLGWVSGKQDQLAAVFGGINLFYFGPGKERIKVQPLNLSPKTIKEIKERTVMIFTGGKRHSNKLQQKLQKGMSEEEKIKALLNLKKATIKAVKLIKSHDYDKLGKLLNEAWEDKKRSNPAVTNDWIDKLYNLAKEKGALGGKIMGAGAGGYMFFFCLPEAKKGLIKSLESKSVKIINYDFDFEGLKIKIEE